MAQALDAVARAAERRGEIGRDVHVQQHHVRVQRGVAEHHVEELTGIATDGRGGEADADVEDVAAAVLDRFDLAHDVAQDLRFDDGGDGHLDALLDGDRLGARLDRGGVRRMR